MCNRLDKTILLYDYEVSNQLACAPFNPKNFTHPNSSAPLVDPSQVTFLKMDNSVKRDQFIQHWRNKSDNFDTGTFESTQSKYLVNDMTGIAKSTSISNRLSNIFHISSREIPDQSSFDKDGENSGNDIDGHESRANGNNTNLTTPFRLANLFSKKNKQEKSSKHSSLKRAKSGIQLERKKPTILTNNNSNNMSVIDAKDRNTTTTGFVDFTSYDGRLGLPSPMRPSRSHESLASPMKPSSEIQDQPSNFTKSSSIKSKLKLLGTQTPSSKSIRLNAQAAKKGFQNSKETIIKLNISPFMSGGLAGKEPVGVHSVHQSLFGEESCFEVKCFNSAITVMGTSTIESSSFETDFSEDDDYTDYEIANDEYKEKQFG